ncbi:MAG: PAS domain S-box protein, partial [Mariprofundaceae bacterium]
MPEFLNKKEFEERIRILEKENEYLAERSEDSLMLGLVSEAIEQADDVADMLDVALERVSMLKDIPLVLCCRLDEGRATVIQSYMAFEHEDINGYHFSLPPLDGDTISFMDRENPMIHFLRGSGVLFSPNKVLMIPFSTHEIQQGIYLFADRSEDQQRLKKNAPILQRITDILTISMENRELLKSYKALNKDLDQRVEERSKSLAESEHKYRALIEGSDAAIMLFSGEKFEDCNGATLRMFGCASKDGFLQLHPGIISPEFQMNGQNSMILANQNMSLALERGFHRFDWTHKRMDGEEFSTDVHLTRVEINDKRMIQGVVIDISKRVNAEKALRESEEKYRNIIDNMQDCLYRTDMDGKLVFSSQSIQSLMCCEPDEIMGDRLSDYYIDPNGRQRFLALLSASPDGKIEGFEAQVQRKDGKVIWLSANSHFIYDNAGEIQGIEGTLRDITVIKEAEESLRKLSQAIEQAGEAVLLTDKQGVIEYVNPAFIQMTGYSADEVIGKNPRVLQSGLQDKPFYEDLWRTILSGKTWENMMTDRRKDGSLFPALASISPIFDALGEITHFVSIQRDMTDLQQMEEKFNQAQKMESIGTLVGGIAHDFNNMLASMVGSLYLLKNKLNEQPELIERVESLEKQSFRAADMIKQLLAFARKGNVEMQILDFNSLVKEVFNLALRTISEDILVKQSVCEESLPIKGDASLLQQILINLLNNARDAVVTVPDPEIIISVDTYQADEVFVNSHQDVSLGTDYARLMVRDNGCGIPMNDLNHIFEPFFTSKPVGKGTGLGLAMIFGSVQTHGGFIDVESTVGEGSTFNIY